jgi:hypothetical protein
VPRQQISAIDVQAELNDFDAELELRDQVDTRDG